MKLNYKGIVEMHEFGYTYKQIFKQLNIPVKYDTFERAVMHYKKTGHERELRATVPEKFEQMSIEDIKPKELVEAVAEYKSPEEILALLKKGCRCKDIGPDPIVVVDMIDDMIEQGYCIDIDNGFFKLATNPMKKTNHIHRNWTGDRVIRFGVVSDTHMTNTHFQLSFLKKVYDIFKEEGIKDVFHAGDLTDGMYPNRSDQIYELHVQGADRQVEYVVNNYPKVEGIETHFILGNHDYTFIRNTGYNIGPAIEAKRSDMHYLGMMNARVWLTPNCDLELNHPGDGAAYALSYSIQKYIDSMSGGDKPKILINGHHHKFMYLCYRNIHAIEAPCMEAQTGFMKSKRIAAHMGAMIIEVHVDEEGSITRFIPEFIPLYKALENDY